MEIYVVRCPACNGRLTYCIRDNTGHITIKPGSFWFEQCRRKQCQLRSWCWSDGKEVRILRTDRAPKGVLPDLIAKKTSSDSSGEQRVADGPEEVEETLHQVLLA